MLSSSAVLRRLSFAGWPGARSPLRPISPSAAAASAVCCRGCARGREADPAGTCGLQLKTWLACCLPENPVDAGRAAGHHRLMGDEVIRRVRFAGALNFRDIGGYPVAGGGMTRWRAVYRSDSLHYLTDSDLAAFDALGVKAVYDLRRPGEIARFPGPRDHVHLEIPGGDLATWPAASLRTAGTARSGSQRTTCQCSPRPQQPSAACSPALPMTGGFPQWSTALAARTGPGWRLPCC